LVEETEVPGENHCPVALYLIMLYRVHLAMNLISINAVRVYGV